jgi:hypothetical protein
MKVRSPGAWYVLQIVNGMADIRQNRIGMITKKIDKFSQRGIPIELVHAMIKTLNIILNTQNVCKNPTHLGGFIDIFSCQYCMFDAGISIIKATISLS